MARIVLYNACVLCTAPLRDLLIQRAVADLFQARWTEEIHDEWTRNLLADRPDLKPESLAWCRELMNRHVSDCLVTGYEALIPTFTLPDPDDRHVLAAAIHGQAEVVVTYNLGDFPASIFGGYGIAAVHPDKFIARFWDEQPDGVLAASRVHRASLRKPPKSAAEYLTTLEQCRLIETVARLRSHEDGL